jgi:hypothetical protein
MYIVVILRGRRELYKDVYIVVILGLSEEPRVFSHMEKEEFLCRVCGGIRRETLSKYYASLKKKSSHVRELHKDAGYRCVFRKVWACIPPSLSRETVLEMHEECRY